MYEINNLKACFKISLVECPRYSNFFFLVAGKFLILRSCEQIFHRNLHGVSFQIKCLF